MEKSCLQCGHRLLGRTDKKFCDNGCRYTYHNKRNSESINSGRRILYAVRKNHRILESLAAKGKRVYSQEELLNSGFDFQAVTGVTPSGSSNGHIRVFEMILQQTPTGFRIRKEE